MNPRPFSRRLRRLASFVLVLAALPLRGDEEPARINSARPFELPDLDSVRIGTVSVTPPPGDATADLAPDLPMPLGPAASPGGSAANNGKAEWIAAPIPFLKPTFGWGVAGAVGCIYQPLPDQSAAPPWISGVGGFYTQNKSWGLGAGHKMNLDGDRWRLLFAGGFADLHYDFYGIGSDAGDSGQAVALNQRVGGGTVSVLRQVSGDWYAGLSYLCANSQTRLDSSATSLPPELSLQADELDASIGAVGVKLQRDSRNTQFFPTRGSLFNVTASFFDDAFGSDFTFQAYEISYNQYFSLATNHVLAARGYGRFTSGRVPYFALCSFGSKGDLRGYTPGRYRDKMMLAAQIEYRWRITARLGAVAFGGLGGVAPELDEFETLLPSAGVGARYVIAKQNNVSLRFDAAWGKNEHAFYFGIGEAF